MPPPDDQAHTREADSAAPPDERTVSIVIVSYNTAPILHACLQAIRVVNDPAVLETIVVDNASVDGSVKQVRCEFPEVRLIANTMNRGFGVANNQGVSAARGRYVLLLNSDALLHPRTLAPMLAALMDEPAIGMVGPRLVGGDGRVERSARRFPRPPVLLLEEMSLGQYLPVARHSTHASAPVPWLLGACLLASRDFLRTLGPFDPRFFMYAEDIDLSFRVRRSGREVRFVPGAVALHLGGTSTARERVRMAILSTASMYLFYRKHYSPTMLALAVLIFRASAAAKWVRDTLLALGSANRPLLAENRRIWQEVVRLRPPQLPPQPRSVEDEADVAD